MLREVTAILSMSTVLGACAAPPVSVSHEARPVAAPGGETAEEPAEEPAGAPVGGAEAEPEPSLLLPEGRAVTELGEQECHELLRSAAVDFEEAESTAVTGALSLPQGIEGDGSSQQTRLVDFDSLLAQGAEVRVLNRDRVHQFAQTSQLLN